MWGAARGSSPGTPGTHRSLTPTATLQSHTGGPATASWQRRHHETRADKRPEEVGRTAIKHPEPGEVADATSKEGPRLEEQPRPVVRHRQAALPARPRALLPDCPGGHSLASLHKALWLLQVFLIYSQF